MGSTETPIFVKLPKTICRREVHTPGLPAGGAPTGEIPQSRHRLLTLPCCQRQVQTKKDHPAKLDFSIETWQVTLQVMEHIAVYVCIIKTGGSQRLHGLRITHSSANNLSLETYWSGQCRTPCLIFSKCSTRSNNYWSLINGNITKGTYLSIVTDISNWEHKLLIGSLRAMTGITSFCES